MIVARICKSKYIDLEGKGAELFGGRWNSPGRPVVYTASCGALAALEYRAHLPKATKLLSHLYLIRIEIPDTLTWDEVRMTPGDPALFLQIGDDWLERGDKPLMRVPSVLVSDQWNWLINPKHPLSGAIQIRNDKTPFAFDSRLLST